jgi:hypothetical protein
MLEKRNKSKRKWVKYSEGKIISDDVCMEKSDNSKSLKLTAVPHRFDRIIIIIVPLSS